MLNCRMMKFSDAFMIRNSSFVNLRFAFPAYPPLHSVIGYLWLGCRLKVIIPFLECGNSFAVFKAGVISRPGAARPLAEIDGVTPVPPFLLGYRPPDQ